LACFGSALALALASALLCFALLFTSLLGSAWRGPARLGPNLRNCRVESGAGWGWTGDSGLFSPGG
jgi:hypothetical protein